MALDDVDDQFFPVVPTILLVGERGRENVERHYLELLHHLMRRDVRFVNYKEKITILVTFLMQEWGRCGKSMK